MKNASRCQWMSLRVTRVPRRRLEAVTSYVQLCDFYVHLQARNPNPSQSRICAELRQNGKMWAMRESVWISARFCDPKFRMRQAQWLSLKFEWHLQVHWRDGDVLQACSLKATQVLRFMTFPFSLFSHQLEALYHQVPLCSMPTWYRMPVARLCDW